MKVPEGSLGESIKSVTTTELQSQEKTKRDRKSKGYSYFSKLDELELDS